MSKVGGEELRSIPGWEDLYSITRNGQVWSKHSRRWLKSWLGKNGYLCISLCREGEIEKRYVHRLVALVWIGPAPFKGAYVCHANDCSTDNRVENLRYDTPKGNIADARRNGRTACGDRNGACTQPHRRSRGERHREVMRRVAARGERHYRAKLTADEVRAIFTDPRSQSKIALDFNIDQGSISRIKNGKKWRHVTADLSRYSVAS